MCLHATILSGFDCRIVCGSNGGRHQGLPQHKSGKVRKSLRLPREPSRPHAKRDISSEYRGDTAPQIHLILMFSALLSVQGLGALRSFAPFNPFTFLELLP